MDTRGSAAWNRSRRWLRAALYVGATLIGLHLFTFENTFPVYYNGNSGGQAGEVIWNSSNFAQPLLLITATEIAVFATRTPETKQAITVVGRWVSAFFALVVLIAFMRLAERRYGLGAALCVAALLLSYETLVINAHFFKGLVRRICG